MRNALRVSAAVFVAALFSLTFTAGSASAAPAGALADAYPCSGQVGWRDGRPIYNCPLWGGSGLEVYANTSDPRLGGNWVVGTVSSARTNWFWCQTPGGWYGSIYGYNSWWAHTKADNLQVGYLPVYYFKGGGNDEPDGSLRHC